MSSRSDSVVDKNCFVKVSIIFFSPRQEIASRCLTCAGHDDSFSIDPPHPFNATRNTRSSGVPVSLRFLPWAETGGRTTGDVLFHASLLLATRERVARQTWWLSAIQFATVRNDRGTRQCPNHSAVGPVVPR